MSNERNVFPVPSRGAIETICRLVEREMLIVRTASKLRGEPDEDAIPTDLEDAHLFSKAIEDWLIARDAGALPPSDAWALNEEKRDGNRVRLEDENGLLVAWVLPMDGHTIMEARGVKTMDDTRRHVFTQLTEALANSVLASAAGHYMTTADITARQDLVVLARKLSGETAGGVDCHRCGGGIAADEETAIDGSGNLIHGATAECEPYGIPKFTLEAIKDWVANGRIAGGFLEAVLVNDLGLAVERADRSNEAALPAIIRYLYNETPRDCHGSRERVNTWRGTNAPPEPEIEEDDVVGALIAFARRPRPKTGKTPNTVFFCRSCGGLSLWGDVSYNPNTDETGDDMGDKSIMCGDCEAGPMRGTWFCAGSGCDCEERGYYETDCDPDDVNPVLPCPFHRCEELGAWMLTISNEDRETRRQQVAYLIATE